MPLTLDEDLYAEMRSKGKEGKEKEEAVAKAKAHHQRMQEFLNMKGDDGKDVFANKDKMFGAVGTGKVPPR